MSALRLFPPEHRLLTLADVAGDWTPTASIESCGFFAIKWATRDGQVWYAALHHFTPEAQQSLIGACRDIADQRSRHRSSETSGGH